MSPLLAPARTRRWSIATACVLALAVSARSALQSPPVAAINEARLRDYAGTYAWDDGTFVDLHMWAELSGTSQLVAIDDSGEIRTLYPSGPDRVVAGPGAAVSTPIESRIEFKRDAAGAIAALTWQRGDGAPRPARRVTLERREDVEFSNGAVRLAGTLIAPITDCRHPAIVLVHGSGAASREQVLPLARFLVRHGVAVLGYDKRGVGASTGDWRTASFDDLAGDAAAAVDHLRARADVDGTRVGLFGWSQAGWVMPIAAVRRRDIAFVISLSGAAVPASETTIDQARHEMSARGLPPPAVDRIVELMRRQYAFARTGQEWEAYAAARAEMAARLGPPPDAFPASPDDPSWALIRRLYFYDPAPTLRRLRTPTLALFGALDHNIVAGKNLAAWDAALQAAGNRDYALRSLAGANHAYLEATVGSVAEMASLRRFVAAYRPTILDWLMPRLNSSVLTR